jgi:uncharacterized Fe-S cluster protein YjdI|eukprot:SAG25_NODE_717_length_5757_cov_2.821138_4_plen_69_part_00
MVLLAAASTLPCTHAAVCVRSAESRYTAPTMPWSVPDGRTIAVAVAVAGGSSRALAISSSRALLNSVL